MATDSSNSSIFSLGSSLQNYNPITSFFRSSMGQVGFINVNEMQSDDPDQEQRIVNGVASYGKQLGRVVEARAGRLRAPGAPESGGWAPAESEAVKNFLRLAEEMAAFESRNQPVTQGTIEELVAALRGLRERTQCPTSGSSRDSPRTSRPASPWRVATRRRITGQGGSVHVPEAPSPHERSMSVTSIFPSVGIRPSS